MKMIMLMLIAAIIFSYSALASIGINYTSDSEAFNSATGLRNWTYIAIQFNVTGINQNYLVLETNITGKFINVTVGGNVTRLILNYRNLTPGVAQNLYVDESAYFWNGTGRDSADSSSWAVPNKSNNYDANFGFTNIGVNNDVSSSGVLVSDAPDGHLDCTGNRMVETWFQDQLGGTSQSTIAGKVNPTGTFGMFKSYGSVANNFGCIFGDAGDGDITASGVLVQNEWRHLACVALSSDGSGSDYLYVNGTQLASDTSVTLMDNNNANALTLGFRNAAGNLGSKGIIGSLRYWCAEDFHNQLNATKYMKFGYNSTSTFYVNITNLPNGTYYYKFYINMTNGETINSIPQRTVYIGNSSAVTDTANPIINSVYWSQVSITNGDTVITTINATDNNLLLELNLTAKSPSGKLFNRSCTNINSNNYLCNITFFAGLETPENGVWNITNSSALDTSNNIIFSFPNTTLTINAQVSSSTPSSGGGGGGGGSPQPPVQEIIILGNLSLVLKPPIISTYFLYTPFKNKMQRYSIELEANKVLDKCVSDVFDCLVKNNKVIVSYNYTNDTQLVGRVSDKVTLVDSAKLAKTITADVRFINLGYSLPVNMDTKSKNYVIFRLENGIVAGIRLWFVLALIVLAAASIILMLQAGVM